MEQAYALIGKDEEGNEVFLTYADMSVDDEDLKAKLEKYKSCHPTVYLNNWLAELSGEALHLIRGHMRHAGLEPPWVDDGVHSLVLELLEFRRRFNEGKRLDLGEVGEEILCLWCQLPETFHSLPSLRCPGYARTEARKEI